MCLLEMSQGLLSTCSHVMHNQHSAAFGFDFSIYPFPSPFFIFPFASQRMAAAPCSLPFPARLWEPTTHIVLLWDGLMVSPFSFLIMFGFSPESLFSALSASSAFSSCPVCLGLSFLQT